MNTTEVAKALAEAVHDGGATLNVTTLTPATHGVVVAVPGHEYVVPLDDAADKAAAYVAAHADAIEAHGHVGLWTHNGLVYFDVVEVLPTVADAVAVGTAHGELAVYDLDADAEILLTTAA